MDIPQRSQTGIHLAGLLREPLSPAFPFAAAKPRHARSEHHRKRPTGKHHRRLRGAFHRQNRRHQTRVRAGASGYGVARAPRMMDRTARCFSARAMAYGVGLRTARCFSARAWRTVSACGPHGASQPVLGVRCRLHTARCFSARAWRTVSASGAHGASQPVLGVRCKLHHSSPDASQPVLGVRCRLPDRTVLLSPCLAHGVSLTILCPVLLSPCLACGVGFRTARCFSACAQAKNLALTPSTSRSEPGGPVLLSLCPRHARYLPWRERFYNASIMHASWLDGYAGSAARLAASPASCSTGTPSPTWPPSWPAAEGQARYRGASQPAIAAVLLSLR